MTQLRLPATLLTATVLTIALAGCGSDNSAGPDESSAGTAKAAAAKSGGDVKAPCDVTDQATVASVFPGAGAGTAGQVRNCEYKIAGSGTARTVNIFYFDGIRLEEYKKQDTDNQITFSSVPVGDAAIKDQLHTVIVQQGDVLFGVQALGDSVQSAALAKNDPQVLALATKIAADLG